MSSTVSDMLKKTKLKGSEIGRIILLSRVQQIQDARAGKDVTPLVTSEDIAAMVAKIKTQHDADDYNRAARIYGGIGSAYASEQAWMQMAWNGIQTAYYQMCDLLVAGSCDAVKTGTDAPVIMTQTEYDRRMEMAIEQSKLSQDEDYNPTISQAFISAFEYLISLSTNRPKGMTAAINRLKKIHPSGKVADWLRENTGVSIFNDSVFESCQSGDAWLTDMQNIWNGCPAEPSATWNPLPKAIERYSFYDLFTSSDYYPEYSLFDYYRGDDALDADMDAYIETVNSRFAEFADTFPDLMEHLEQFFISYGVLQSGDMDVVGTDKDVAYSDILPYTTTELAEKGMPVSFWLNTTIIKDACLFPDNPLLAAQAMENGIAIMQGDERDEYPKTHTNAPAPLAKAMLEKYSGDREDILASVCEKLRQTFLPAIRWIAAYNCFYRILADEIGIPKLRLVADQDEYQNLMDMKRHCDQAAWLTWYDNQEMQELLTDIYPIIQEEDILPQQEQIDRVRSMISSIGRNDTQNPFDRYINILLERSTGGE